MIYKVLAIMLVLALTMGLTYTGVVSYIEGTVNGIQTVVEAINPQKSDTMSTSLASAPLYDGELESVATVIQNIIQLTTPYEGLLMDGVITHVDSNIYSVRGLVTKNWNAVRFICNSREYLYLLGDDMESVGYFNGSKGSTGLITEGVLWTVICRYDFTGKTNTNLINIVSGVRIVKEDIDTIVYLRQYYLGSRGGR